MDNALNKWQKAILGTMLDLVKNPDETLHLNYEQFSVLLQSKYVGKTFRPKHIHRNILSLINKNWLQAIRINETDAAIKIISKK